MRNTARDIFLQDFVIGSSLCWADDVCTLRSRDLPFLTLLLLREGLMCLLCDVYAHGFRNKRVSKYAFERDNH